VGSGIREAVPAGMRGIRKSELLEVERDKHSVCGNFKHLLVFFLARYYTNMAPFLKIFMKNKQTF